MIRNCASSIIPNEANALMNTDVPESYKTKITETVMAAAN